MKAWKIHEPLFQNIHQILSDTLYVFMSQPPNPF
jgi:hypothetical protein